MSVSSLPPPNSIRELTSPWDKVDKTRKRHACLMAMPLPDRQGADVGDGTVSRDTVSSARRAFLRVKRILFFCIIAK